MAARRPFKRVIGVEVSESLSEVARQNMARVRQDLACQGVELVTADVLDWDVPDDLTVAYFQAPFPTAVFQEVLDRLLTSVESNPRPLRLILVYDPASHEQEIVMRTGRRRV